MPMLHVQLQLQLNWMRLRLAATPRMSVHPLAAWPRRGHANTTHASRWKSD